MGLRITWTDFSTQEIKDIFEYHKVNFSIIVLRNLIIGIVKEILKLKDYQYIRQREELLKDDARGFRYLPYKNYKIIYLLDPINNTVEIFDVFDTRQNPFKMNREN
jgi:plasmid stabilization system protein ParE